MDFFDGDNAYWGWIGLGLVLGALEMLVPGVYLVWLAVAALITGLITFVAGPPLALQVVAFVSLALIAAFSARRWFMDQPGESADPLLNNLGGRLVGETGRVTEALEGGKGRVQVGDGEWMARGADAAVGTRVRITSVSGTTLLVEPQTPLIARASEGPE